jgi:V8-like Glu-specific endopeptidase
MQKLLLSKPPTDTGTNEKIMNRHRSTIFSIAVAIGLVTTSALAQVEISIGDIPVVTALSTEKKTVALDYRGAQPMPLPSISPRSEEERLEDVINALTSQPAMDSPGYSAGRKGNGKLSPTFVGPPKETATSSPDVEPQEFGSSNWPFSTSRIQNVLNTTFPSRASGKLFFTDGASTYVCSASLIKRGIVVTAAHCLAQFGAKRYYTNFRFIPAYREGSAPYGVWVGTPSVLSSYFTGTDPCSTAGVVCQNDVGVLRLTAQNGALPGTATGWLSYGWNGVGFTGNKLTQITQLGYPVCLDSGAIMERTDSQGFISGSMTNNTIIGSLMCGGSSGGPWLINFGVRPSLTGTTAGSFSDANVVVGVTSWGYTSTTVKQQGASPFLSTNIVPLVNAACVAAPAACQ